jgi:hypothetical protein
LLPPTFQNFFLTIASSCWYSAYSYGIDQYL